MSKPGSYWPGMCSLQLSFLRLYTHALLLTHYLQGVMARLLGPRH